MASAAVLRSDETPLSIKLGELPPFRKRRAAFVANLLCLFFGNEASTKLLRHEVGCIESYGGRLIPILKLLYQGGHCDLVVEEKPQAALLEYFADSLGLDLPDIYVLPHDEYLKVSQDLNREGRTTPSQIPANLKAHRLDLIDGYVTDEKLNQLARFCDTTTTTTPEGSRRGNNKLLLHQHLEEQGLPVFDTVIVASSEDLAQGVQQLSRAGYRRAVLKSQIGASGIGIEQFNLDQAPTEISAHMFYEGSCLLQGWLEPGLGSVDLIFSPSVQIFLDDETGIHLFDLTEQILSHNKVHEGNISPSPHLTDRPDLREQILSQAQIAARWLFQQGYRGTGSIDFLVASSHDQKEPTVYICEINARITGATYPALLAHHLKPGRAWLLRNLKFAAPLPATRILRLLDEHGHLFQVGKAGGVVPLNFNANANGLVEKGQFLCLGSDAAACHTFLLCAEQDLPIDWEYIRD